VKESRRSTALVLALSLLAAVAVNVARAAAGNYWDRLAACETHSRWHQRGTYYVGGLGIYHGNWDRWAPAVGVNKPAYLASREEQIRVAIYGRRVDRAWWGCMRIVGLPW
jgi:Transglycosylase-like domain